jgi:hypothetical protein
MLLLLLLSALVTSVAMETGAANQCTVITKQALWT